MINKQQFFDQYNKVSEGELKSLGLTWENLTTIHEDHKRRAQELLDTAQTVTTRLAQFSSVHSLKHRIKHPEHLIEKIIRKKRENPERELSVDTYREEITDLIGVRALHLFKDDWAPIHKEILDSWELLDGHKPIAFIRKGDDGSAFEKEGCNVQEHQRGYRSVHYVIKLHPTKTRSIVEVQVRTIFEEGWSEVDHRIAYPKALDDPMLSSYLAIFNVLAGNADSMATFIRTLSRELAALRGREAANATELEKTINSLDKLQKELGAERGEKTRLQTIVASLREHSPPLTLPGTLTGVSIAPSISTLAAYPQSAAGASTFLVSPLTATSTGTFSSLDTLSVMTTQKKCPRCSYTFPPDPLSKASASASIRMCPVCGTVSAG